MFLDRVSSSEIKISTIKSLSEFADRADEWDRCLEANDGDIYFTSGWIRIWWKHYGKNRNPLFILAYSGDRCVACVPFFEEKFSVLFGGARVVRLCGVHHDYPVMRLPVDLTLKGEILEAILDFLLTRTTCDVVSFSPLSSLDPSGTCVATAATTFDGWRVARNDTPRVHSVSFLPDSPDGYLMSLPSRERKNYRHRSKRLAERMAIRDHVADGADGAAVFAQIVRLQTERMHHYGGSATFDAWPGLAAFYLDLISELVPRSRMVLSMRYGDEDPICGQIGFRIGQKFYWHITGRSMRSDIKSLGVGNITSVDFTKSLVESGVRVIEDAAGVHSYKERFGGEMHGIRRVIFVRNSQRSSVRAKILLGWMQGLHLLFFNLWHLKWEPKIARVTGWRHRPFLAAWIATRL